MLAHVQAHSAFHAIVNQILVELTGIMVGCRTSSVEEMTDFRQIMHRSRGTPPRERWAQRRCKALMEAEGCEDLACKRCVKWHDIILSVKDYEYKRLQLLQANRIDTSSTIATYNHCLGELWRCKAIRKGHVWTLLRTRYGKEGLPFPAIQLICAFEGTKFREEPWQ